MPTHNERKMLRAGLSQAAIDAGVKATQRTNIVDQALDAWEARPEKQRNATSWLLAVFTRPERSLAATYLQATWMLRWIREHDEK